MPKARHDGMRHSQMRNSWMYFAGIYSAFPKLASTISPVLEILAILVPEKLDATCCLLMKVALVDHSRMVRNLVPNWFRRQSFPSSQKCVWPNRRITGTAKHADESVCV